MKQYKVREVQKELKKRGYSHVRTRGSHEMWSNGIKTLSLPSVTLVPIIAYKLMKEA